MRNEPSLSEGSEAEAALWVVRLQAPDRKPDVELAFRRWAESDPSHAAAFARTTEVWEALGGAGSFLVQQKRRKRLLAPGVMAIAAGVAAGVFFAFQYAGPTQSYSTQHGEQRQLKLSDGSRLTLNTDSEVDVRYSRRQRTLTLKRGEVLFEVAKNAQRPFIVQSGDRRVRAVGTVFEVAREQGDLKVTLLEGKVTVSRNSMIPTRKPEVALNPGQQWSAAGRQVVHLDPISFEQSTAWLSRRVVLADTPLSQAVAEMNRYSHVPITVDAAAGAKQVSGIFAADASESFANSVAALHNLTIVRSPNEIQLKATR